MLKKLLPLLLCAAILAGCQGVTPRPVTDPTTTPATSVPATTVPETDPPTQPTTLPPTEPTTQPPRPESFLLSFAGDCTFGNQMKCENDALGFLKVVGDDYAYPLSNVREYFENDDFSFVNLEGTLTDYDPDQAEMEWLGLTTKRFRFRGPREYAQILTQGGVEFANAANNHARDYGMQGWRDTMQALEDYGVLYASYGITCLAETPSGLKIGIISISFDITEAGIKRDVADLRSRGAELIVLTIHWGIEGDYTPSDTQRRIAHMAIDNGVDIIHGHHTHTLQPIEYYNGGIIFYSLGNFSFGGNYGPRDMDTAIIQQQILRDPDGTVRLGALQIIPCRISSVTKVNDYRPTPYEESDPGFHRVFSKLTGTFEK